MSERRVEECIYCGAPALTGRRTCRSCRELEELDPFEQPARRPLTEGQHGVRSPFRVPRRGGRRELY